MTRSARPAASSPEALTRMTRQRRRDTGPEMAIRRLLFARGLRYRVDAALPGMRRRADMLFRSAKVAVFVDGCFWHGCPEHGTRPKSNASWWAEKIATNVQRDRDTDQRLAMAGWHVMRVWEHEPAAEAARRIADLIADKTARDQR
jgi:DNA mismatch endonuclease (patch repair protein)